MTAAISESQIFTLTTPSGLLIKASIKADNLLDEFYRDYDAAFVLANEKEGYAGFRECLELNSGEAYDSLKQRYGLFREFVLVAYDPGTGIRIGGANFITFPLKLADKEDAFVLSINLNYIFINQNARNQGYFSRLVRDFPDIAFQLLASANPDDIPKRWAADDVYADKRRPETLMFIEQNDPFLMSDEDYRLDTQYTGLDQIARIGIWTRLGAKIIDFPYVQPPLTSAQEADHNLVLAVLGLETNTLDSCLLHKHLERFFGISVLKGKDMSRNSSAEEQLSTLLDACRQGQQLQLLATELPDMSAIDQSGIRPASLRDALRTSEA